jgi:ribosome-binding factor A
MPIQQRKNTNRIDKVNSLIQKQVGETILPMMKTQNGLVTVSRAETSRDMKWVKVWISIVGGNDDRIMKVLQNNIYDIQGALNRALGMKIVPRIQFFLDTSPRYVARINELIRTIHEEDRAEEAPHD